MVDKMCHGALHRRSTTFSVPDYLFVSTRVARAFPGVMESELVLAYSSTTVSAEQSKSWEKIGYTRRSIAETPLLSALTFGVFNGVLFLGSQPLPIQSLLVSSLNPIVVSTLAFLGSLCMNTSIAGVPIGFGIAFVLAGLCVYWLHNPYDPHAKGEARDPFAVTPVTPVAPLLAHEHRSDQPGRAFFLQIFI